MTEPLQDLGRPATTAMASRVNVLGSSPARAGPSAANPAAGGGRISVSVYRSWQSDEKEITRREIDNWPRSFEQFPREAAFARVARPQKQKRGHTSLNVFQVFQNETCGAALVVTIFLKNFEKLSKEPEPRFNFEVERRSTRVRSLHGRSAAFGDLLPAAAARGDAHRFRRLMRTARS